MTEKPSITPSDVAGLVKESGYPFELMVAETLSGLGFDINASFRYFDKTRGADAEIDLIATKRKTVSTTKGREVRAVLRLAVECKASALPYVFFGLPAPPPPQPEMLDDSYHYVHVNSSRDGTHPERYGMGSFLNDTRRLMRSRHHHFSAPVRFHQVTGVEITGAGEKRRMKLHVPGALSDALRKFAGFNTDDVAKWSGLLRQPGFHKVMDSPPTIIVKFFLLVHATPHFRQASARETPLEAMHTPLFTSFSTEAGSTSLAVDFISLQALRPTIETIESSFNTILETTVPTLIIDTKPH